MKRLFRPQPTALTLTLSLIFYATLHEAHLNIQVSPLFPLPSGLPVTREIASLLHVPYESFSDERKVPSLARAVDPAAPSGLNLEPCNVTTPCLSPRVCKSAKFVSCTPPAPCFCIPQRGLVPCSSWKDCHKHESCVDAPDLLDPTCVSNAALTSLDNFEYEGTRENVPAGPNFVPGTPTPSPTTGFGATYSVCRPGAFCQTGACRFDGKPCNETTTLCRCEPDAGFKRCLKEADCTPVESCIRADGIDGFRCIGDIVIPSLNNVEYVEKSGNGTRATRVGATFDQCFTQGDCLHPRTCQTEHTRRPEGVDEETVCKERMQMCRCFLPKDLVTLCDSDADCPQHEYCYRGDGGHLCVSLYCKVFDKYKVKCEGDQPIPT